MYIFIIRKNIYYKKNIQKKMKRNKIQKMVKKKKKYH